MKVLYLYSGDRKNKTKGQIHIDYPDTQLYGLNHLHKFGIQAEYKEIDDLIKSRFLAKLLPFRLKHLLLFFLIKRGDYDIVFGSSLLYPLFFKKFFKVKSKFILLNISLNRTLAGNKKKFFKIKVIKWLLQSLDGIVCLSNFQKIFLKEECPFLKNKIFFVPLGVDVEFYKPKFTSRDSYILSVGRDNGRDYKTVVEVAKKIPETVFKIICSKRNLKNIGEIPSNVKVLFDIGIKDLKYEYENAKTMLIITHKDNYTDGADCSGQTVLLDAMASGLPVIATKKEYLSDYVSDNEEALVVSPYDYLDIFDKLKKLEDPLLSERLSRQAIVRTRDCFSTLKMAENLSIIFKKMSPESL